jgi:hypothetical protein
LIDSKTVQYPVKTDIRPVSEQQTVQKTELNPIPPERPTVKIQYQSTSSFPGRKL